MNPTDFKTRWLAAEKFDATELTAIFSQEEIDYLLSKEHYGDSWTTFDTKELDKSPLLETTKAFLKNGFPEGAAPYLNFGWRSYDMKFYTIYDYFSKEIDNLDEKTKHYCIFGSDGTGDEICFDTLKQDKLVQLCHEENYQIMCDVNNSVAELAECILLYKEFVRKIQLKYGMSALSDRKYTKEDYNELVNNFLAINPLILNQSDFWRIEIANLKPVIK